jgi:hypothetical protein
VDVHGLAKSAADGSPSVPHMVITKADAGAVHNYHIKMSTKPKLIQKDKFENLCQKTNPSLDCGNVQYTP